MLTNPLDKLIVIFLALMLVPLGILMLEALVRLLLREKN